jgi:hypothetical protein
MSASVPQKLRIRKNCEPANYAFAQDVRILTLT